MQSISGLPAVPVQAPVAPNSVKEVQKPQSLENEGQGRPAKTLRDAYTPAEKPEPSGRYWVEKDEDGGTKIFFDAPEPAALPAQRADKAQTGDAPGLDKTAGGTKQRTPAKETESCTANTDRVDRELKELKEKREALKSRLGSETDEAKLRQLQKELKQVESELSQKDTNSYRRQQAVFS